MSKNELTIEQRDAADKMYRELVGFTIAEAKQILKELTARLEYTVVEEAD